MLNVTSCYDTANEWALNILSFDVRIGYSTSQPRDIVVCCVLCNRQNEHFMAYQNTHYPAVKSNTVRALARMS